VRLVKEAWNASKKRNSELPFNEAVGEEHVEGFSSFSCFDDWIMDHPNKKSSKILQQVILTDQAYIDTQVVAALVEGNSLRDKCDLSLAPT